MTIGKIKIDICQYCGGSDIRYGYLNGYSRLQGTPGFADNDEPIHHLICAECGAIIFSWITNPRKYSKNIPDGAI